MQDATLAERSARTPTVMGDGRKVVVVGREVLVGGVEDVIEIVISEIRGFFVK